MKKVLIIASLLLGCIVKTFAIGPPGVTVRNSTGYNVDVILVAKNGGSSSHCAMPSNTFTIPTGTIYSATTIGDFCSGTSFTTWAAPSPCPVTTTGSDWDFAVVNITGLGTQTCVGQAICCGNTSSSLVNTSVFPLVTIYIDWTYISAFNIYQVDIHL